MLQLLKYDKSFVPAKRNFDRKPTSEIHFKDENGIYKITINNN